MESNCAGIMYVRLSKKSSFRFDLAKKQTAAMGNIWWLAGFLNIFSETTRSIRTKLCKNDVCEIFYKKPHYVFELACSTVVIFPVYNLVLVATLIGVAELIIFLALHTFLHGPHILMYIWTHIYLEGQTWHSHVFFLDDVKLWNHRSMKRFQSTVGFVFLALSC